mmetsp:Transcript_13372/g.43274  ORF Transcript_13372/g.43274 Transcript_13372/m.43274 type:complete len:106 (-) Transcript_13372:395-712(-)
MHARHLLLTAPGRRACLGRGVSVRAHERFLKEKRNVPETFIESCNAASRATVASLRDSVHLYMHVHNDSLQVPPHAAEDTPPEMLPKFIKHVELGQQTCWFGCLR